MKYLPGQLPILRCNFNIYVDLVVLCGDDFLPDVWVCRYGAHFIRLPSAIYAYVGAICACVFARAGRFKVVIVRITEIVS